MVKTVESSLQVSILTICKVARTTQSSAIRLEWVVGPVTRIGVAFLTDAELVLAIDGQILHAPMSRREFRKDRFQPHIQCLACGRNCFALFIDDGQLRCRRCAGLIYESQRVRALGRASLKAQKIAVRLSGHLGETVPPRPAGMWRRTYLRHLRQLSLVYRSMLEGLPSYRPSRD